MFIFQLAICFILLILAVSVVRFRPFEDAVDKVKEKIVKEKDFKYINEINNSLKCCLLNQRGAEWPDYVYFLNSCCDNSKLVPAEKTGNNNIRCPAKKAYEDCFRRFLDKQQGFKAAAVIFLTLAIIFQLLLTFSFLVNKASESIGGPHSLKL